jgi:hypothetical protein
MDGWMDGFMDGWMDGWMDGSSKFAMQTTTGCDERNSRFHLVLIKFLIFELVVLTIAEGVVSVAIWKWNLGKMCVNSKPGSA